MRRNLASQNGFSPVSDGPASLTAFRWRDVRDTDAHTAGVEEIERIPEVSLRQIMLDLRDGKSTHDSAARLGISKSQAGKMRIRGCQLVAERLGQ